MCGSNVNYYIFDFKVYNLGVEPDFNNTNNRSFTVV